MPNKVKRYFKRRIIKHKKLQKEKYKEKKQNTLFDTAYIKMLYPPDRRSHGHYVK